MDADPVRRRQGRLDPGDDQSRLPAQRAGIRAEEGRLRGDRHGDGVQDQQLHGDAQHFAAGAGGGLKVRTVAGGAVAGLADGDPDRRPGSTGHDPFRGGRAHGRSGASRAAGHARCCASIRRSRQHPVHQRHHRLTQGRHADPPQHPQQRLFHGTRDASDRTGSHLHSGAALSLLRHGDGQPCFRHARHHHGLSRRGL